MYCRVPANLANPIVNVTVFRVLKYTNIDTRYTKSSCIVYKALHATLPLAFYSQMHRYATALTASRVLLLIRRRLRLLRLLPVRRSHIS